MSGTMERAEQRHMPYGQEAPRWLQYVQPFGIVLLGVSVFFLGFCQWLASRERLKTEVLDRRLDFLGRLAALKDRLISEGIPEQDRNAFRREVGMLALEGSVLFKGRVDLQDLAPAAAVPAGSEAPPRRQPTGIDGRDAHRLDSLIERLKGETKLGSGRGFGLIDGLYDVAVLAAIICLSSWAADTVFGLAEGVLKLRGH